ncbi:MAG: hypothetical protein E6R07_00280 [Nevskiaceae bacterium]|nr:MAG: hypothetical protein E6R07_00280 [Nevskiaceae bacterium]
MKRTLICTALSLSLAALPILSEAHGPEGRRGGWDGYRGGYHEGYHEGYRGGYRGYDRDDYRRGGWGHSALPWVLGAVAVGAAVSLASGPYSYAEPAPVYGYVAPPPPPVTYYAYPAPVYSYPRTCTYYPDGSSVCR